MRRETRKAAATEREVSVDLYGRSRASGIAILALGPYLFLAGLMGPHGEGGGGIAYSVVTLFGIASTLCGLLIAAIGVSRRPGGPRYFVRAHIAICGIIVALLWMTA